MKSVTSATNKFAVIPSSAPRLKRKVNAAVAYLASLGSDTSRSSMGLKLNRVARLTGASSIYDCNWDAMTPEDILLILRMLETEGKAGSTINNYLAAMKGVAKASWLANQMSHEMMLRIKVIKERRYSRLPTGRALSYMESARFLDNIDRSTARGNRDYALAALFLGCGVRRAEATFAELDNYDPDEGTLRIIGKGNKERMVYLPDAAKDALNIWIDKYRGYAPGAIFCRILKNGTVVPSQAMDPRSVGAIMKKRMEDAAGQDKAKHFSTHDFRRTFATRLLADNVDIAIVQKLMGHANISTTASYDRRGEEEKKQVGRKVKL